MQPIIWSHTVRSLLDNHLQAVHCFTTDEVVGAVDVVHDSGNEYVVAVVASR